MGVTGSRMSLPRFALARDAGDRLQIWQNPGSDGTSGHFETVAS